MATYTSTPIPTLRAPTPDAASVLFGADATQAIVSVQATYEGRARVWRRLEYGTVLQEDATFSPWVLLPDLSLLGSLSPPVLIFDRGRFPRLPDGLHVGAFELEGDAHYRYLVLAREFGILEQALLRAQRAERLWDLREQVYYRPPAEQYLIATGRTYYKGMLWEDVRRMQFDLETTSLDPLTGEIFMISLREGEAWESVLDARECGGEAALLNTFVELVRERDPDVLEGHNVFDFDLPYLMARAEALGVRLALGRESDVPVRSRDALKVGARNDRFTRYSVAGREIVDTLHAVKRRDAIVHDIRSYGLKAAARYFGLASEDREYVEGEHIYSTWQQDADRVRRYALDDVREVDGLSRLLMASSFALAGMVPKQYERIATAGTGQGLIEPLLVRAYLWAGRAIPKAGAVTTDERYIGGYTRMYLSGIFEHVVKADVASLYPSIMLAFGIGPRTDSLRVFPSMLRKLTDLRLEHKALGRRQPASSAERVYHEAMQGAMKILINSFYGSMGASFALFGDIAAATQVTQKGQEILLAMMSALRSRGLQLIEADTDGVYFTTPPDWTYEDELRLIEEVGRELPEGIAVEHDGRYARMYSYQEKNYILQDYQGEIKMVGAAFKSSRNEPYGEKFFNEALPKLLECDFAGVHDSFERTVMALRNRELPVEDLAVTVQLTKSEEDYRSAGKKEEQYEVLVTARRGWSPGDRVRYYQAARGRKGYKKLYEPGATDYDAEYYVKKLRDTYAARLAKAVAPEDLNSLFGEMRGMFDRAPSEIRPVVVVENHPE
ncbi:MAG: ribonuclease H-like domain-containing protein [Chloroflexota bacterium]|nr:ribonuclease H-like domain-containing protein [Chloroflexota bacterium]